MYAERIEGDVYDAKAYPVAYFQINDNETKSLIQGAVSAAGFDRVLYINPFTLSGDPYSVGAPSNKTWQFTVQILVDSQVEMSRIFSGNGGDIFDASISGFTIPIQASEESTAFQVKLISNYSQINYVFINNFSIVASVFKAGGSLS